MGLDEYRRKRREGATNEPFPDELAVPGETRVGAFVVHLHAATRLHYDLRVEAGGALASFAVPHGPSLVPLDKRLAVHTEDHPLEYLAFEGIIPEGQYGAGAMIAWDRGVVEYLEGPSEEGLTSGKLDMILRGHKLRGRFALVRTKGPRGAREAKQESWLLIKKRDAHATSRDVVAEEPRSVLSGLTVDELASARAIGDGLVERARRELGGRGSVSDEAPALAPTRAVSAPPADALFDPLLAGVRVLATREGDLVRLLAPRADGPDDDVAAFYPEIVRALRALVVERVALDGRLVAFDRAGYPSLALLARRAARMGEGDVHAAAVAAPVELVATDLLRLGDADTRPLPFASRRALLSRLVPERGVVRASEPLEGPIAPILAFAREHGIDAITANRKDAAYGEPTELVATGAEAERATVDHGRGAGASLRRVTVTNRAKVFFPERSLTKGDLCDYYAAIAPVMLPYLEDRPVILVRYPDGIDGKSFFQWNVPVGMPAWVKTLEIDDDKGGKRGFLVDDAATLLYLANLACIPIHVLACRAASLDRADFFTIDFDLKQASLAHAITLARALKELLDAIGLPGFPKTSGQTGLHVLVPLGRDAHGFDTARTLADLLGRLLVERHPDIATMERVVGKRGARVYVDTGQTGPSRAIVAPYSVRAVPAATVSMPLRWEELAPGLDPRAFDLASAPGRVARDGDPMAALLTARPDVPTAIARLAEIVSGRGA